MSDKYDRREGSGQTLDDKINDLLDIGKKNDYIILRNDRIYYPHCEKV